MKLAKLAKKIRSARKDMELMQWQVSEKIDVSRSSYVNLELGRGHIKFDKMVHLAKILKINPVELFDA